MFFLGSLFIIILYILYIKGFSPEDIGALHLEDVECKSDEILDCIITQCRKLIEESGHKIEDFYVTVNDDDNDSSNETYVCKLWHKHVFLGATAAGVADPGKLCRDYVFERRSGKFMHMKEWT